MTMVTAIVSPMARPSPRMTAPRIPARPLRSTPVRTISHRVAPSASTASRWWRGTATSTSRVIEAMIGMIMIAKMIPAASMPMPNGGPVKSPVQPSDVGQGRLNPVAQQRSQNENRPKPVNDAGDGSQQLNRE